MVLVGHWLAPSCRAETVEFAQIGVAVSYWLSACPRCRESGFDSSRRLWHVVTSRTSGACSELDAGTLRQPLAI
eukprot:s3830_g6.t1